MAFTVGQINRVIFGGKEEEKKKGRGGEALIHLPGRRTNGAKVINTVPMVEGGEAEVTNATHML